MNPVIGELACLSMAAVIPTADNPRTEGMGEVWRNHS
jgi:hypothetical protein